MLLERCYRSGLLARARHDVEHNVFRVPGQQRAIKRNQSTINQGTIKTQSKCNQNAIKEGGSSKGSTSSFFIYTKAMVTEGMVTKGSTSIFSIYTKAMVTKGMVTKGSTSSFSIYTILDGIYCA